MKDIKASIKLLIGMLLLLVCITSLHAQQEEHRYKIHGEIIDARTKKPLKKVPIKVLPFNRTVNADKKGAFLFNMPAGKYTFELDYYPFDKKDVKLNLTSDTTLVIALHAPFTSQYIDEVEVVASKRATETPAAIEQIDQQQFKLLPAIIGERDILKAFTLTSGVTSSSEGAADLQVRGGTQSQNLYLLDGIPLYSTEHFFGMVSVYNPTIIKSAKLYKSGFPAEYGGKISSIVNVKTQDANLKKFKGEAEIGLLTSKLALNVPLVKDKLALSVAGRISNYSLVDLVSPFLPESTGAHFSLHFGDINANLFWKISDTDQLKLIFFSNTDGIDVQNSSATEVNKGWLNNHQQNLNLNWYKKISEKAENHLMAYADIYGYDYGNSVKQTAPKNMQIGQILTGINSFGLVEKFNYKMSGKLNLNAGASLRAYGFSPYQINVNDSNINSANPTYQNREYEGAVYTEGAYQLSPKQTLTAGFRLSSFGNIHKVFINPEPRLRYHGIFANDYSISASIDRMTQPIHRVANAGLGLPVEMFFPSSSTLLPGSSWNFSLGGAKDFSWDKNKLSLRVDGWYKTMQNIVEYQDGYDANVITELALQNNNVINNTKQFLAQGSEKAYGVDVSANYNFKNLWFTANYTLMKAECQFDDLNDGRPFAAPTDIRHSLSLTSELKFSDTWFFTATWQYNSGRPITVPTYLFLDPTANGTSDYETSYQQVVTERNNYRTKPFHKLDISFTHNYKTLRKHHNASISLGIYNVYNRANTFIYYIDNIKNTNNAYYPVLKSMSLFPILPMFSWSLKF